MKLLFIIHNIYQGGAERVLSLLVNELAERGHQIYILTDPHRISYEIDDRVNIISAYNNIDINKKLSRLGTIIRYIKLMTTQYGIIKKLLKEENPDVIVSFMGMCIWQLIPFRKKYKIIISDHSAMEREFSIKMNFERRRLPESFFSQTVLTERDKQFLGIRRNNVVVMHNPMTYQVLDEPEYDKLFYDRKDILACGSLDRYYIKGFDNLIKAFSLAVKDREGWYLDIAGGGDVENERKLKEIASENNVESKVRFLGYRKDVDKLMQAHAIFAHTPRSEGFGMVLTEAMASGCPVVCYNLSGPSEIIRDNIDGLLVENQNIEMMAIRIRELMDNKEERNRLGKNALKSVTRFSLAQIVDKWELLFKEEQIENIN